MKRFLLSAFVLLMAMTTMQAQHSITRLGFEMRGDWQFDSYKSEPDRVNHSAFEGKFANLRMDGVFSENITYSIRYRLHKVQADPWAATDWATLTYSTDRWDFSAGKQVVAIGGYEYDRAPIDIYFASEYWHQIACYQFGVSATYKFDSKVGAKLLAQICQSPYDFGSEGLYAYNLMYVNDYTLSSINLLEYAPNRFLGYIALGDRSTMGPVTMEWDVMTRFDFENEGVSFSSMLDLNWAVSEKLNVFGHASYDVNEGVIDPTVMPGTDIWSAGGGVEYFPLGNRDLRIHAASNYVFGRCLGALSDGDFMFQMGLTWRLNLIN